MEEKPAAAAAAAAAAVEPPGTSTFPTSAAPLGPTSLDRPNLSWLPHFYRCLNSQIRLHPVLKTRLEYWI